MAAPGLHALVGAVTSALLCHSISSFVLFLGVGPLEVFLTPFTHKASYIPVPGLAKVECGLVDCTVMHSSSTKSFFGAYLDYQMVGRGSTIVLFKTKIHGLMVEPWSISAPFARPASLTQGGALLVQTWIFDGCTHHINQLQLY